LTMPVLSSLKRSKKMIKVKMQALSNSAVFHYFIAT
jgi:hypothetical protein